MPLIALASSLYSLYMAIVRFCRKVGGDMSQMDKIYEEWLKRSDRIIEIDGNT